eukprot:3432038-Prorocentrum_lima.AAC.1
MDWAASTSEASVGCRLQRRDQHWHRGRAWPLVHRHCKAWSAKASVDSSPVILGREDARPIAH